MLARHSLDAEALPKGLPHKQKVPWVGPQEGPVHFRPFDRRADIWIGRGAVHMACDEQLQHMGVVLDTSVRFWP